MKRPGTSIAFVLALSLAVGCSPAPASTAAPPAPIATGLIAFYSGRDGATEIYTMNSDGSGEQQVTHQGRCENPAWSPDGSELAFQSDSQGNFEICAVNVEAAIQGAAGATSRRLTNVAGADMWPTWTAARD